MKQCKKSKRDTRTNRLDTKTLLFPLRLCVLCAFARKIASNVRLGAGEHGIA